MTDPSKMTPDEFVGLSSRRRTGLREWLRSLPVGVPTKLPDELSHTAVTGRWNRTVGSQANAASVRIACRTIDGERWVMRLPKEHDA